MSTNIIERLVLELSIDLSKFTSEADKAIQKNTKLESSLKSTETAAKKSGTAYTKLAKDYANASTDMTAFVKTLQASAKWFAKFSGMLLKATDLLKLANDVAKANVQLSNLSRNLSMTTTDLNAWQNIAVAAGGTADGMTSALNGLKQSMNSLVMFGDESMLPYFNSLGVSIVDANGKARGMNDVMLDLSDAFKKMPNDQAYTLAKKLGLDDGTINTLMLGRKELQSLLDIQKKMYQSDAKAIANSQELSKQQMILNSHWQSMKKMIGDALIPILGTLVKTVNAFFEFMQKNKNTITHVFQGAAIFIGLALIPLLKTALVALVAFIAPFAPFILTVTALGAAFIALYDDYKTWAEGGKSLFDWGIFKNLIDSNILSVDNLKAAFKGLGNEMLNYVLPSVKDFMDIVMKLKNGDLKSAWTSLVSLSTRPVESLLNIGQYAVGGAAKVLDAAVGVDSNSNGSFVHKINTAPRVETELRNKLVKVAGGTAADMNNANRKGDVKNVRFRNELHSAMDRYGIKGEEAKAFFLANVDNETDGGQRLSENPRYSLKSWKNLAPNQLNIKKWMVAHSASLEADFKALSEQDKLNIMYANKNGNREADDGYKFRGRGGMQLTGRANYQAYANYAKRQDIMKNPDLLATDPYLAADSAAWFYMRYTKAGREAKAGNIAKARETVNGGNIGKSNTMRLYEKYRRGEGALALVNGGMRSGAIKAQAMLQNRNRATNNSVYNDNKKQVDVNIQNINIKTASATVDGNVLEAVKSTKNYLWNQLGTSLS